MTEYLMRIKSVHGLEERMNERGRLAQIHWHLGSVRVIQNLFYKGQQMEDVIHAKLAVNKNLAGVSCLVSPPLRSFSVKLGTE